LTYPKNTSTRFLLAVFSAILFLQWAHRLCDVPVVQKVAEQASTVADSYNLRHQKNKYLEEGISTRVSSPSFSSINDLAEIPAGQFFFSSRISITGKNSVHMNPLLRKLFYHAVNIHAP